MDDLAGLGGAQLLGGQQIHRDDDAHQQILQKHQRTHHAAGEDGHQRGRLGQNLLGQPGLDIFIIGIHLDHDPGLHLRVGLQQMLYPAGDDEIVILHVVYQLQNALV